MLNKPYKIGGCWQGRQGDLLFVRVADKLRKDGRIPLGGRYPHFGGGDVAPEEGSEIVLAEGESTGHKHVITAGPAIVGGKDDNITWLNVIEPTPVRHDEHKPLPLEEGVYMIIEQREFDYEAHEARFRRAVTRRRWE